MPFSLLFLHLVSCEDWSKNTQLHNAKLAKQLTCEQMVLPKDPIFASKNTTGYMLCGFAEQKKNEYQFVAHEAMYVHAALHPMRAIPSGLSGSKRRVFLDIGTNAGYFSVLAQARGYEVFSFEPQPMCNDILIRTKQEIQNHATHPPPWHIFEVGVSDAKALKFEVFSEHCGMNWHIAAGRKTKANAAPLHAIIHGSAAAHTPHPVFAKIDVDGGEARILKSIHDSVVNGALRALPEIIIEINPRFWTSFGTNLDEGQDIFLNFARRYTQVFMFNAFGINRYGNSSCEAQPAARALLEPCPICAPADRTDLNIMRVKDFAVLLRLCVDQDRLGNPRKHGQMNIWFAA